jgi:hypothetical protein
MNMNQHGRQPMNFDASKPASQSLKPVSGTLNPAIVRTPKTFVRPLALDPNASVQPSRTLRPMLTLKPQAGKGLSREATENQIKNFFQK